MWLKLPGLIFQLEHLAIAMTRPTTLTIKYVFLFPRTTYMLSLQHKILHTKINKIDWLIRVCILSNHHRFLIIYIVVGHGKKEDRQTHSILKMWASHSLFLLLTANDNWWDISLNKTYPSNWLNLNSTLLIGVINWVGRNAPRLLTKPNHIHLVCLH